VPLINSDNAGTITAGSAITGYSSEASGTIIKVYTSANVVVATTTVQSGGLWSTINAGTIPTTYTAAAGTSYYATATNGTCSSSVNSGTVSALAATSTTRCGTITGTINSGTTSVSGTVSGSFTTTTVTLYLDGVSIGSTTTTNTAWGPIDVTNKLYSNGVLTIGVQESGSQEVLCTSSAKTIGCNANPMAPIVTPDNATISQNQSQTYTITNPVSGVFYGIADGSTGGSLATGVWATSTSQFNITTNPITSPGTVAVVIKATSLVNLEMCTALSTSKALQVNPVILPVVLIRFVGSVVNNDGLLAWQTASEFSTMAFEIEKSSDGRLFTKIGSVRAKNNASGASYNYTDPQIAGPVYYRIKIVDANGYFAYSNVVALNNNETIPFNVHPNPFFNELTVTIQLPQPQKITAALMDANGRTVAVKEVNALQGITSIEFQNLRKLPASVYYIKVKSAAGPWIQKVIKSGKR